MSTPKRLFTLFDSIFFFNLVEIVRFKRLNSRDEAQGGGGGGGGGGIETPKILKPLKKKNS